MLCSNESYLAPSVPLAYLGRDGKPNSFSNPVKQMSSKRAVAVAQEKHLKSSGETLQSELVCLRECSFCAVVYSPIAPFHYQFSGVLVYIFCYVHLFACLYDLVGTPPVRSLTV